MAMAWISLRHGSVCCRSDETEPEPPELRFSGTDIGTGTVPFLKLCWSTEKLSSPEEVKPSLTKPVIPIFSCSIHCCENADLLASTKPRKFKVAQQWQKSDFRGLPQRSPKSDPTSSFWSRKKVTLLGSRSHIFGSKSCFWVTFRLVWGRLQESLFSRFSLS